mgnify:CR=1 FL=1
MKKIILPLLVLLAFVTSLNAQNFHIAEDFNTSTLPAGWTNTAVSGSAVWSFGIDGALVHNSAGNANQNLDGTPFAYFDDDALGVNSNDNTVELKTPVFNNATNLATTLEFDYNVRFYNTIPDSFYVEVFDGLNWVVVFSRTTDDCGNYTSSPCTIGFPHAVVDISAYANANCQVRFTYFDGNDPVDWGWYVGIDNVEIYSPFPNDVQVSSINRPISSCGLSAADTIEVTIKNIGTSPASNFGVSYSLNGAAAVNETVTATILPNDSLIYKFNTTGNFAAVGTYTIEAFTSLALDGNIANDSSAVTIENDPIFSPTYSEDFEGASTGWVAYGTNSSWQLGIPPAPLPYINTAASGQKAWVTNLTGNYNNFEQSYLESPCFDFSQSIGDPIVSFAIIYKSEQTSLNNINDYLFMESSTDNGLTWSKVPAAPIASNWYNNNVAGVWADNSNGWINVENVLLGLAGESQVKLRFALVTDGFPTFEGFGIDKFSIRNPQNVDMGVNTLLYPSSTNSPICGYGSNENIIIQIENKGANPVNSYSVSYQVDNGTIYTENVNAVLPPSSRLNYTFNNKFNFSALRNYNLRVWVNATGDGFTPNDTLENLIVRNTQNVSPVSIPYAQNFNSFIPPNFNNGWSTDRTGFVFRWESENSGVQNNTSTGPIGDHGGNGQLGTGIYIYTEASNTGFDPSAISPCIDLSNNSGARMSFWYHKYGSGMGNLFVDVYDGNGWINGVDQILGQTQTSETDLWREKEVSLNAYAGRRIKIRFRASRGNSTLGDMAIDDFFIFEPRPKDANLLGAIAPESGCDISGNSVVQVEVNNMGTLTIMPDSMFMYYQIDNLPPVKDTFDQILPTEQTTTFSFTQTANFSVTGKKYNLKTWVELPGDPNFYNDTVFNYQVINHTRTPNFTEDMETFRDASCEEMLGQVIQNGWYAETGQYSWQVQNARCGQGDMVTPTASTGPNGDHTTAKGTGYFMYTSTTGATTGPNIARFYSPCIDLTNETSAGLNFWYHKFGNQMGNLSVEADTGTGWINLLTISGQTQSSAAAQWSLGTVDLTPFVGNLMQVRFSGTKGSFGNRGNMAIDDIFLYRPSTVDVGVTEISSPSGDNCNLPSTAPITVKVKNFGLQATPANSVEVKYTNNGGNLIIDTIPQSIAAGAEVTFTFSASADLTGVGEQVVRVSATTNGDTLADNNAIERLVVNRRVGLPYYFQDFERFEVGDPGYPQDDLKSWSRSPNGTGHTWHVWQGNAPTMAGIPTNVPPIPANGPSGDHTFATDRRNGDGIYMVTETPFSNSPNRADASLDMACNTVDLSNSANGKILLSFWYHMFGGNTGDIFVDVHNGTQWIRGVSVIRGVQMAMATDPWKEWQVNLDNFAGVSNAKIRFRSDYIEAANGAGGGDIGIDDISILDRELIDVSTKVLKRPISNCDLSNSERVRVEVQNTGSTNILQLNMGYQVTHTGLDNAVTVFPPVRESRVGLIVPLARYNFEFTSNFRPDMSIPGKYEIKVWAENPGDAYAFNDTLFEVIENTTNPFPSCVDFSRLTYGDKGPDYQSQLLPNNWTTSTSPSFAWTATIEGGGPAKGSSSGVNDIYMLLQGGMPGQQAWMNSNCFDLTSTSAANLRFNYQADNPNHKLYVKIREVGGAWIDLDTLEGYGVNAVESWQKVEIVLADYLGQFVEFQFFVEDPGGYYAIDDVCVISPPPQEIELEQIYRPFKDLCFYSDADSVHLRIQNVGVDRIDSFRVILGVDTNIQKIPVGQYQRDTFWIYHSLEPGEEETFVLDSAINMSYYTTYFISAMVYLPGDIDTTNNFFINYDITHGDPRDLPYIVDFEDPVDPGNGLQVAPGPMMYTWELQQGLNPNFIGTSGPSFDHTLQNSNGTYVMTISDVGQNNEPTLLISQCIDLQNTISPEMSYWYHMFGADPSLMGNLYLQINDDFGWVSIDSLKGADPDHIRNSSPWKERKIDLSQYAGKVIKFRFISFRGSGPMSNMGIDDISIYDLAPSDAAAHALIRPNEKRWSCYTDTQSVRVAVRNNGSLPIDFDLDTLDIQVNIKKNGLPWDTLYRRVTTDVFRNQLGNLTDLPKDSVVVIEMDSSFDMSEIGATFEFETILDFYPDLISSNDIRFDNVLTRREPGVITIDSILPNDTVCYGTQVRLLVENYFGAIQWQEKLLDANGNGFWLDGFTPPVDSPFYSIVLDTTSELRVQICRQVETLPVKVEVIKPYQGRALDNSRCGPGALTLGLITPSNINQVNVYLTDTSSSSYITLFRPTDTLPSGELQWDFVDNFKQDSIIDDIVTDPLGRLDTIMRAINTTHTLYAETIIDSCSSPFLLPINGYVNVIPSRTSFPTAARYDTVCQDTSIVLNAGGEAGRKYTYDWTITYPDGSVLKDSVQTIIIDAWRLSKDSTYKFSVVVTSDSGCVNLDGNGIPIPIETDIFIADSCITGVKDYKFGDEFSIYPNPTNDDLYIEYRSLQTLSGKVSLLSMQGKLIEEQIDVDFTSNRMKFNLGSLPKGIYFIRIETAKGSIVRKIIKS